MSPTTLVTPVDASHRSRFRPKQTVYKQERTIVRARDDENAPPQDEPKAKRMKYKTTFQEITTKKNPIVYKHGTDVPPDYKLVKYGREKVTTFLLNQSRKYKYPVWIARNTLQSRRPENVINDTTRVSYHVSRVGYYFQKDVVAKAEKWFEIRVEKGEIKDDQDAHRPQITKNDLRTCLDEIYPLLPARDHSTILNRLNPRTGTSIGKAKDMNPYKQVELAVVSHIRHSYTDYEKLLLYCTQDDARQMIQTDLVAKLAEWKGEDTQDEYETSFKEVVDLVDGEEVETLDDDDDRDFSGAPPLKGRWQVGLSEEERVVRSRPWSHHPDVDRLNPALSPQAPSQVNFRPPPQAPSQVTFGSQARNGFHFRDHTTPSHQSVGNMTYSSPARPSPGNAEGVETHRPPPRPYEAPFQPAHPHNRRVMLRPLTQAGAYHALPPPPMQAGQSTHYPPQNAPVYNFSDALPAARSTVPPPPGAWADQQPTLTAHQPTMVASWMAAHPHPLPPSRWQHPTPVVQPPIHWRSTQPTERDLPAPPTQIRYRQLSPEDVVPSMEAHSPPRPQQHHLSEWRYKA